MTFAIAIVVWRKPGLSPAEFRKHYEDHVPLIRSLAGNTFPITHTRHYIQRKANESAGSDNSNAAYPAAIIFGDEKELDYDAFAELVFEDEAKFQEFFATLSTPENMAKLTADEEKFIDRSKVKLVNIEQVVTTRA